MSDKKSVMHTWRSQRIAVAAVLLTVLLPMAVGRCTPSAGEDSMLVLQDTLCASSGPAVPRERIETFIEEGQNSREIDPRTYEVLVPPELPNGLSPPFHVGGDPEYGAVPLSRYNPAVASDGRDYLVVWQDDRTSSYCDDIYGARMDSSGVLLDHAGILISSSVDVQSTPAIAFDGTNYVVVWSDRRNGDWDIYGARVNASGVVLDPDGIPISIEQDSQEAPAIVFDGTQYMVAWSDRRNGDWDIYAARVSLSGEVLDPEGLPISVAQYEQSYPGIASDGSNSMVFWHDRRASPWKVYCARIDAAGTVLDPDGIAVGATSDAEYSPGVAFDGAKYIVAWIGFGGSTQFVYGARVDPSGVVLDVDGIQIAEGSWLEHPVVSFAGENYVVAWQANPLGDLYGARVDTSGAVLDPGGIVISDATSREQHPATASNGAQCVVAWQDLRGDCWQTYGARMDPSGSVLDPSGILVSEGASSQMYPDVAFDGVNYLVVWHSFLDDSRNIYGTLVDANGNVLPPGLVAISTATDHQRFCAVAFNGTNYLIVWQELRNGMDADIYGVRMDTAGNVIDADNIPISTAPNTQGSPELASDGMNWLVVWRDFRSDSGDIYGARVNPAGVVLDPDGILISGAPNDEYYPSVVFGKSNYFVTWEDNRTGIDYDIYGARVTPSGDVLDPVGIPICATAGWQEWPAAAFNGTNYLVVWEDGRNGQRDVYGTRVDVSGNVMDSTHIPISTEVSFQSYPAIAFDGATYFVFWDDSRSITDVDVYGARVSSSGVVLDVDGLAISAEPHFQRRPAVTAGAHGSLLIVYYGLTPPPVYGSFRIWGNMWQAGPTDLAFTSVQAATEGGHVTLSWQMGLVVEAASFTVERSEFPGGEFNALDLPISEGPGTSFFCTDNSVVGGRTYWYRIVLSGVFGEEAYGPIVVHVDALPAVNRLCHSYPNPFNPHCTIRYELLEAGRVSLRVFDVDGSFVRTLVDAHREPGNYSELWDGKAEDGVLLPSGVYFYRLEADGFADTRKMVLLR